MKRHTGIVTFFFFPKSSSTDALLILLSEWVNPLFQRVVNLKKLKNNEANGLLRTS